MQYPICLWLNYVTLQRLFQLADHFTVLSADDPAILRQLPSFCHIISKTSRDRNAAEIAAEAERTVPDRSNTVRNGDTGKIAAISERTVTNRSNTAWNVDTGKIAAIAERIVAD